MTRFYGTGPAPTAENKTTVDRKCLLSDAHSARNPSRDHPTDLLWNCTRMMFPARRCRLLHFALLGPQPLERLPGGFRTFQLHRSATSTV